MAIERKVGDIQPSLQQRHLYIARSNGQLKPAMKIDRVSVPQSALCWIRRRTVDFRYHVRLDPQDPARHQIEDLWRMSLDHDE